MTTADKLEAPCEDCGEQPNGRLHDSTHVYNHRYTPLQGWVAGNTADKLEAEAKRWKNHANMLRQQPITPHGLEIAEVLSWVVERDEALAVAWRSLQEFPCHIDYLHNDDGDYVYDCGKDYCLRCKALNMINALEIE